MGRKVGAAVSLFLRGGGLCLSVDVGRRLVATDSHCRRHDAADRSIQRADDRVDVFRSDQLVDRPTAPLGAYCAAVSSGRLATCPNIAFRSFIIRSELH